MHLFAAQPGGFSDDEGIIDLDQRPARLVVLSAADSVLSLLAASADNLPDDYPSLRLANWLNLKKPAAFDLYADKVLTKASDEAPNATEVVVLSLLGGASYWQYGLDELRRWADVPGRTLVVVPGEDYADPELLNAGNVDYQEAYTLWRYLREGGPDNAQAFFGWIGQHLFKRETREVMPPQVLPRAFLYRPSGMPPNASAAPAQEPDIGAFEQHWAITGRLDFPRVILTFYRSHLQAADTAMFDALISVLHEQGLNVLPLVVASLKEPGCLKTVNRLIAGAKAELLLNTTGFAIGSRINDGDVAMPQQPGTPLDADIPVIQLILASTNRETWQQDAQGLRARDIAMQISLPELDGRIISRAVAFKSHACHHSRSQMDSVRFSLEPERAVFVAQLAKAWIQLRSLPNADKKVAMVLANYPANDAYIGNGVGLDTPASALNIIGWLLDDGYTLETASAGQPAQALPSTSEELMQRLRATLDPARRKDMTVWLPLSDYQRWLASLPEPNQTAIHQRWGTPDQDPTYDLSRQAFAISGVCYGHLFIGVQPARGFAIDQQALYHDPDLVPTHGYLAFYCWLRQKFASDAVIHLGKHGNLEWLPGKSTALSSQCWPDIALGPLPHLYPFIVNDPGEGAQAKRRSQAVIIDHLMPPMTRAELYGDLAALEELADEYYQAMGVDPRRQARLKTLIAERLRESGLIAELGLSDEADDQALLDELDTWLCDIKEAAIRNGLHVLGECPQDDELADTLLALLRLPRGSDQPREWGLLNALAHDLGLPAAYDPLDIPRGHWHGPRPHALMAVSDSPWITASDTRERLELLAQRLIVHDVLEVAPASCPLEGMAELDLGATRAVLEIARERLLPALQSSAQHEQQALLDGLSGYFIAAGPSGAPTRGRLDVLPTGRNFFAVDSRAIPSKTAWELGHQAAEEVINRYLQEHGDYPRNIGMSVWGTATMRTGGDDIAQAMALMGIEPVWAPGSQRLTDFRIIPAFQLGRPRVDVTLRVSGLFRDAFPNVIALLDAAVQALAAYADPGTGNPIRENIDTQADTLVAQGETPEKARRRASYRIFGARPGAYGAGVQGVLDNGAWQSRRELAAAYVQWGGYAYGQDLAGPDQGQADFAAFEARLNALNVVLHNQDNREHDVLDSADYSHFQGGMSSATEALSGHQPALYFGDHANPAKPRVRSLKEEFNRVLRSRLLNPKWQAAMREHGYKGAFEMAASVNNLFAFDATTAIVDDYQYADVKASLLDTPVNKEFMSRHNPAAQREITERLLEAIQRNLWDATQEQRQQLEEELLRLDECAERGE